VNFSFFYSVILNNAMNDLLVAMTAIAPSRGVLVAIVSNTANAGDILRCAQDDYFYIQEFCNSNT
jgi:hypothetical protein